MPRKQSWRATMALQYSKYKCWPMCRDLISSADTILDMTTCCNGVVTNLKQIQVGLSAQACTSSTLTHPHLNSFAMGSLLLSRKVKAEACSSTSGRQQGGLGEFKANVSQGKQGKMQTSTSSEERLALYCEYPRCPSADPHMQITINLLVVAVPC